MVNKKGYIRTLEAIIAIVLIFIFIISILPKKEIDEKTPDDIDLTGQGILNEIQNNNLFRDYILNMDLTTGKDSRDLNTDAYKQVAEFIDSTRPIAIDSRLMVCEMDGSCFSGINPPDLPKVNIYTKSILINRENGDRIIKLFLWRKV